MKTLRTAVTAALVAALAGCGTPVAGTPAPQPAPPPPATSAPPDPAVDKQAVEDVFSQYRQAWVARDFATVCAINAPETTQQLIANLESHGITTSTCEEALQAAFEVIPDAAQQVETLKGATVRNVRINGDNASITLSVDVGGRQYAVTNQLRRIDGDWRVIDTGT
jgi:hypothetical protein